MIIGGGALGAGDWKELQLFEYVADAEDDL